MDSGDRETSPNHDHTIGEGKRELNFPLGSAGREVLDKSSVFRGVQPALQRFDDLEHVVFEQSTRIEPKPGEDPGAVDALMFSHAFILLADQSMPAHLLVFQQNCHVFFHASGSIKIKFLMKIIGGAS